MQDIFQHLEQVIEERSKADADKSYVASLLQSGAERICKKVGEEASEVIIASLAQGKQELVGESADLLFHLMVLLSHHGVTIDDITGELQRRIGTSGLDEKATRADA